jgi:hypothetical protein
MTKGEEKVESDPTFPESDPTFSSAQSHVLTVTSTLRTGTPWRRASATSWAGA